MNEALRDVNDGAAREAAVAANGSVLVQAPAGSGKTTLLTQRFLRLLALVDAPERILALTFTRRAAQEMRQRVLDALGAAAGADCPAGMNARTWSLAVAARRRMDAIECDLALQPSRLRIETIDAFNSWLASQLPVAAGLGAALRILADARPAYDEAARRALAHEASDPFGRAVDRVLELDDQRWRKLVKLIAEMLPSRDRWLPLLAGRLQAASALDAQQLQAVRQHFDEDLKLLVTRVLLRAQEVLGAEKIQALSCLMPGAAMRLNDDALLAPWRDDLTPLRAQACDVARWRCMATLLMTSERALRKKVNIAQGFPPGCADKAPMLDLLIELQRDPRVRDIFVELRALPEPAYSEKQWDRVREVAQVLVLAAAELEGVFREQGEVDFPAISLAALRALGTDDAPTDLSLRLDYRLQHILIDEFQDTSSAQLELLRLLTMGWQQGDGRSVFCVGDPMQSIYGFRQAEVRAFLELAEVGVGELRFEVQRLQNNFRSAPAVVEWINACFSRLMPSNDDRYRGAIAFRASHAAVSGLDSPEAAAAVSCLGYASRVAESAAIAELIGSALQRHPDWRIAVLVRAKSHAREIAASLHASGIAFRAVDIEPLHDRSIVRDIIMLTSALLHLGDRIAWLAVLRAPWSGLLLPDLLLIARAAPLVWDAIRDQELLAQLSEDARARCERLRTVIAAAFAVRNDTSLARWVERTWIALGAPSCAASPHELELASAAFARLRRLEERGMPDAAELAGSFADLFADHGTANAVEIMTIHKAKGLEFDMVVVPALNRPVPPNRDQLLLSHQFARAGRDGMVMGARPPVGSEKDLLFEFLRWQRRDVALLEAQRLLYVACTRAKWRLVLTAQVGNLEELEEGDEPIVRKIWTPAAGSLLSVLWPVVRHELELQHIDDQRVPDETDGAPRGGALRRYPSGWSPPLHPIAPEPQAAVTLARDETPIFEWAGETARRVGSLVHAELQTMQLPLEEATIRARASHYSRWLSLHGVPKERLPQATARVTAALLGVLKDPRGRWLLSTDYGDDFREHALSGLLQGEVSRAVLDRSFVDADGVRWVIDYKTSQHQGSGLEQFLDQEVERYRPQLRRYAQLVRRLGPQPIKLALYFPLMAAWREWDAEA